MTTSTIAEVFSAIKEERDFQDKKWGTIEEHPHEVGSWIIIMRQLLKDAEQAYMRYSGNTGALDEIRKVVSVGVACLEQHGVVRRDNGYSMDHLGEAHLVRLSATHLTEICHKASYSAGWWNDLETGEPLVDRPHVVGEKLMLIVSEVAEAMEGHRKDIMDKHLPHRSSMAVELADAVIRISDLAGALQLDLGGAIAEKLEYNRNRPDHKIEARKAEGGKAY